MYSRESCREEFFHIFALGTTISLLEKRSDMTVSLKLAEYSAGDKTAFQHPRWGNEMSHTSRLRRKEMLYRHDSTPTAEERAVPVLKKNLLRMCRNYKANDRYSGSTQQLAWFYPCGRQSKEGMNHPECKSFPAERTQFLWALLVLFVLSLCVLLLQNRTTLYLNSPLLLLSTFRERPF